MKLLKLIGVLMDYPHDGLWQHGAECSRPPTTGRFVERQVQLRDFVRALLDTDPLVAQGTWLSTFDRGRSMSLLLFEHIHGESRGRGQAMVDLIETYRKNGFELAAKELPDYLPLLLEYLSQRAPDEARDWLGHVNHIVGLLAARAGERGSPYALLFTILTDLAAGNLNLGPLRQRASEEPRDDTVEVMDRLWEEEAVRFGGELATDDCSRAERSPPQSTAVRQAQP